MPPARGAQLAVPQALVSTKDDQFHTTGDRNPLIVECIPTDVRDCRMPGIYDVRPNTCHRFADVEHVRINHPPGRHRRTCHGLRDQFLPVIRLIPECCLHLVGGQVECVSDPRRIIPSQPELVDVVSPDAGNGRLSPSTTWVNHNR
jgi:hypothetical protein